MASLALGIGGAVIGGFLGGPLGASIGYTLGSALGNLLDPPKVQGPRLTDLKIQTSEYGKPIPLIYGVMRTAGNVIWIGNDGKLVEHEQKSGGKGGPEVTNYTYSSSFAVLLCEGPIAGVNRVWADGRLVWTVEDASDDFTFTLYKGDEEQLPDPTMEADLGAGNVPAHRGTAYVVFDTLYLTDFGNRIPSLEFEVVTTAETVNLRIVDANYNEPVTLYSQPAIFEWTDDSIVCATTHRSPPFTQSTVNVQRYNQDLSYDAPGSGFTYPCDWGIGYLGIGNYKRLDGSTQALWMYSNSNSIVGPSWPAPNTDGDEYPPIITAAAETTYDGYYHVHDQPWLANAGVPLEVDGNTLHVVGAVMTADSTILFVFTNEDGSNFATHWWEIYDAALIHNGTIDPPIDVAAGVYGPQPNIQNGVARMAAFENNARYMWFWDPVSVSVLIYHIDGGENGNLAEWDGGRLRIDFPTDATGMEVSMKAIGNGYCGMARGKALLKLARVGVAPKGIILAEIVGDLSNRAGLVDASLDVAELTDIVDGFRVAEQMEVRNAIQPLRDAYFFDGVEHDNIVRFVKRGKESVGSIPDADLAAREGDTEAPPLMGTVRGQEPELPRVVNVKYLNTGADYQPGAQIAQRQVGLAEGNVTLDLPIAMDDQKARAVAHSQLYEAWLGREAFTFNTTRKYAKFEPTDVIDVRNRTVRIVDKKESPNGIIRFEARLSRSDVYAQPAVAVTSSGYVPQTVAPKPQTDVELLDIPLIDDADEPVGFYVAMGPAADGPWTGATLYRSSDGGSTYDSLISVSTPDTMGAATTTIGEFSGGNVFDESNVVTVVLTSGELSSASEAAVLNGANIAVLGSEIIQFKTADLVGDSTYDLSGLLRGRRGTEWAIHGHVADERFVLLPVTRVSTAASELFQTRNYKAVTSGKTVASATDHTFTNNAQSLRPYSPVNAGGGVDASGNATIAWSRRTRVGGVWLDYVDVPLGETTEGYVVQIWDSNYVNVARIIETTSPTATYSAAQQVTDFGATQLHIYATIGQKGAYTLGTQTPLVFPGAGASDDGVIAPIPPYNSAPPPPSGGCTLPIAASTFNWASPVPVYNPDAGPDGVWIITLTTGASVIPGRGSIDAMEFEDTAVNRTMFISLTPCGTPLGATSSGTPANMYFYMTGNPYPTIYPTLLPSTTYYVTIYSAAASGMVATLTTPT